MVCRGSREAGNPSPDAHAGGRGEQLGGIAPSNIPTLSFPMLLLMGLGLVASAFLLVRRL